MIHKKKMRKTLTKVVDPEKAQFLAKKMQKSYSRAGQNDFHHTIDYSMLCTLPRVKNPDTRDLSIKFSYESYQTLNEATYPLNRLVLRVHVGQALALQPPSWYFPSMHIDPGLARKDWVTKFQASTRRKRRSACRYSLPTPTKWRHHRKRNEVCSGWCAPHCLQTSLCH